MKTTTQFNNIRLQRAFAAKLHRFEGESTSGAVIGGKRKSTEFANPA